ncbi:hypothetical protein AgCh_023112 [Apium graveolens]
MNKQEWIIDSGCSHHVTGNDSVISGLRKHDGDRIIVTADDSAYPVVKEGVVEIGGDNTNIRLDDVYHVPGLKKNLVSVSQITNSGKYVLFGPNDVKVFDNMKKIEADIVLTGDKKRSLFVMSVGEAYVKKTSHTDNASIWHARLGHVATLENHTVSLSNAHQIAGNDQSETTRRDFGSSQDNQQSSRRSTREKKKPDYLKDYEVRLNNCTVTSCFFAGAKNEEEPTNYEEATGYQKWEAAMQEEIEALDKNETWELVPKP